MADNPAALPIITLDTNALVQSIPTRGRFRPIIEGFDAGRLLLVVSHEVLVLFEDTRLTVRPLHPALFIERYL
jgi:hypothetical protein